MSANWRTYSVFVSSTFADMQAERDYLESHVFPLINDELKKYAITLRVIDLRSGINTLDTSGESQEEKVIRVCLDEINRSKPFFLGLLGNRYGTRPKAADLRGYARNYPDQSITAIEISYGFLQRADIMGCLFLERDSRCYQDIKGDTRYQFDDSVNPDRRDDWTKLQTLKTNIKAHLRGKGREHCYLNYSTRWNGRQMEGLDDFGQMVKDAVLRDILAFFHEEHDDCPFTDEQRTQEGFLHLHRERIYTRQPLLNQLVPAIKSQGGMQIIAGDSGCGKSCLYTQLVDHFAADAGYVTLFHATDTGQENRDVNRMLARWIYELEQYLDMPHRDVAEADGLVTYFRNLIKRMPDGVKLLLFIDGVEGFYRSPLSEYLTFYPKSLNDKYLLCCTCQPLAADRLMSYHKAARRYQMPALTRQEAEHVVSTFTAYDDKELYPPVVTGLLGKTDNGRPCFESPLWTAIALQFITRLTEQDFKQVASLAKDQDNSFDRGLIAYILGRISLFPASEGQLFRDYLQLLHTAYGQFPVRLFQLLSVSYNGLDEAVIARLMGAEWDIRTFAIVRSYLQGFITEQSQLRNWQLTHQKLRLRMQADVVGDLCAQIATLYMERWREGQTVCDNIVYYLIAGRQTDLGYEYLNMLHHDDQRVDRELAEASEVLPLDEVMEFLFLTFEHRKQTYHKLLPASMMLNRVRIHVSALAEDALRAGNYDKVLRVVDVFHAYLFQQHIPHDFKLLYYMLTVQPRLDAVERTCDDRQQAEEYRRAIGHMRVRGPLSLLLAPVAMKYYRWQLSKLK